MLEIKLQKAVIKITNWDPHIQSGASMRFCIIQPTMFGLVINLVTHNIPLHFQVLFDDMFTTITSNKNDVVPSIW